MATWHRWLYPAEGRFWICAASGSPLTPIRLFVNVQLHFILASANEAVGKHTQSDREMKINSVQDLAAAARGRRISLGLTQTVLAVQAGVSRPWLSQVEAGKPSAEIGLIIRLLDALDL